MEKEVQPSQRSSPVVAALVIVLVVGTVATLGYYEFKPSSCSGYPPGGNCVEPYSYSFAISVNYTGQWKLNYSGQTNVGESNPYNVTGTHTGSGDSTFSVTLSGLNNRMLYVCATAQKLDATNSTLYLSIGSIYPKNTSVPDGSVFVCAGVAP